MTIAQTVPQKDHPWRAWHDFAAMAADYPDRPALRVDGKSYSYGQLKEKADGFAGAIQGATGANGAPVTGIFADRSVEAYAGLLAALFCGHAYVPLNPKFPDSRNQLILERAGASSLIGSPRSEGRCKAVLAEDKRTSGVPVLLTVADMAADQLRAPSHDNGYAYVLFTSGSTGIPKGVAIRHSNLSAYLEATFSLVPYTHMDKVSQNFDLTFDLSVHDLFCCWRAGGELIVPSEADLDDPAAYIQREAVTAWFSVPSLGQKMALRGSLTPAALQGLRISLFCGEALPMDLALKWQAATGQSVENWYGPTEATIACTRYVLPDAGGRAVERYGLTPIGQALPGMKTLVLGEDGREMALGEIGELLVMGPQLADGYLADVDKTAAAFVDLPAFGGRYYRTGDRVLQDETGAIFFVDRIDNQIKIRGYRVELGEIEAEIRNRVGGCSVVVTPLPLKSPTPTALLASVEGWTGDTRAVLEDLKAALPSYMVPTDLRMLGQFPQNASGKIDRGAIGQMVTAISAPTTIPTTIPTAGPTAGTPPAGQPRRVRKTVIDLVQSINPAITRARVMEAPDLMEAGLDSLAFTELTLMLEKTFGIALNQMLVARMSEMSIQKLVPMIKRRMENAPMAGKNGSDNKAGGKTGRNRGKGAGGKNVSDLMELKPKDLKKTVHYRARRALECVDNFPKFVADAPHPLALFIGSSGIMSATVTSVIEDRAAELGVQISAANLGTGKLSNAGTTELAEFVRDTVRASGKEIAFVMYEVEVMNLSTLPSGREIEVVRDYLDGRFVMETLPGLDPNSIWDLATGGTIGLREGQVLTEPEAVVAVEPDWMHKRTVEVMETYLGNTEMVPAEADIFLQGVAAMQEICPTVIGFVHPLNLEGILEARAANPNNRFDAFIADLQTRGGFDILPHTDFVLDPEDYRDKNHVNKSKGARALSVQMAQAAVDILKAGR